MIAYNLALMLWPARWGFGVATCTRTFLELVQAQAPSAK
jgi:hypothetical protein